MKLDCVVGKGFNRDAWARFEAFVRRLPRSSEFDNVYVCTGPLYEPFEKTSSPHARLEVDVLRGRV